MIDWLACALVRGLGWVFCRLSPSAGAAVGEGLGWLASWLQPKRARIGYLNLKAAFGDRLPPARARRIVRRVFGQMGAGLVEMLRLPVIDGAYVDRHIEFVGYPHFEAAVASGRPVVLLTAHFGNWELTPIIAALKGYPVLALARAQQKLPRLYRLLISYRESKGGRIIHKGHAMRQLVQALDRRELIGVVGDQASRHGIFVDFFGRPAQFATGPFELAVSRKALILSFFLSRVRGPFHRMVIEPPLDLSHRTGSKDEIVRWGVTQFVATLKRQIEQDPAQWLWLHKRWKHTPARRVVILSDGKLGHLKQSLAVLQALKEHGGAIQEQVIEVRYRHRLGRALAFAWAWVAPRLGGLACLRVALEPACFRRVAGGYADLVISCGASTAPVNVLISADNRAKSIVVMDPALPLRAFTLALIPAHDQVARRRNVLQIAGALSRASEEELEAARHRLQAHPRFRGPQAALRDRPVIAVLLGGDTPDYELTASFADALLKQVLAVCEEADGHCLVTTSRRTHSSVERFLTDRLSDHPRCRLLLLASRDQLDGTMAGMLGWAQVVVVTGESISMLSEACASGRHVVVVRPPLRSTRRGRATKSERFIRTLLEQGYVHHPSLPEVGHAIRRCLSSRRAARRLDTYAAVRDAVARLI